jgi:hypothetical protein
MTMPHIKDLFANDVERPIEEVIKVDQTDEQIIKFEIDEYVVTMRSPATTRILDVYNETPNKPRDGIGIWVSGFFGSGKSSFAKMLGLALENRTIVGTPAASDSVSSAPTQGAGAPHPDREEDPHPCGHLRRVHGPWHHERQPDAHRDYMYRLFSKSLGYAEDLDLAELEISLEKTGELDEFKRPSRELHGKDWDDARNLDVGFARRGQRSDASDARRHYRDRFVVRSAKDKADINPGKLADRPPS